MLKLEKSALKCWPPGSEGCIAVLEGEYEVEGLEFPTPPTIIDCGANVGSFAVWASARWPGSTIFCYEPNPVAYAALVENIGDTCVPHKCAIGLADGKAPYYEGVTNLGAGSLKHTTETGMVGGVVKLVHASRLPECDVLKIDTEGSELDILENYPHLAACKAVLLEWHSQRDREEIRALMGSKNFSLVYDKEWAIDRGIQKWVKIPIPHLYVAVLSGGGKTWVENHKCVQGLIQLCQRSGVNISVAYESGTGVDRARNRQVAEALKIPTVTHFMFLDDDIVFDPQAVLNMIYTNFDLVGGAYPRKEIDWEMVDWAVKQGIPAKELAQYSTTWIVNTVVDNDGAPNAFASQFGDFVEVEELGTGFLLMKRSVLERMIQAYGRDTAYITDYAPVGETQHMLFACQRDPRCERELALTALKDAALAADNVDDWWNDYGLINAADRYKKACKDDKSLGRYLTEDYSFCRLWRMLGGKVYLYLTAHLEHLGMGRYCGQIRHVMHKIPPGQEDSLMNSST